MFQQGSHADESWNVLKVQISAELVFGLRVLPGSSGSDITKLLTIRDEYVCDKWTMRPHALIIVELASEPR